MSVLNYTRSIDPEKESRHSHYHGPDGPADVVRKDYTGPDFDYTFNSIGFRGPEPQPDIPALISFGCSHTVGIGVPEHLRFADQVAAANGLKHFCFAAGGSDNLSIMRNVARFFKNKKENIDVELVIILWSEPARLSVQHIDERGLPWIKSLIGFRDEKLSDYQLLWAEHSAELYTIELIKAVDAITELAGVKCIQICAYEIKMPYFKIDSFYSKQEWYRAPLGQEQMMCICDQGRDTHPGILSHTAIANEYNKIYENIK
jgi:hypothetical protein